MKLKAIACFFIVIQAAFGCGKRHVDKGNAVMQDASLDSVLRFKPQGEDLVIWADSLQELAHSATELAHLWGVISDEDPEIVLKNWEQSAGVALHDPGPLAEAGFKVDAETLIVARDAGITLSLKVLRQEEVRRWLAALRTRLVAQHPDALGLDVLPHPQVELHMIAGEAVDVTWFIKDAWLHLRFGGKEIPLVWANALLSHDVAAAAGWLGSQREALGDALGAFKVVGELRSTLPLSDQSRCGDALAQFVGGVTLGLEPEAHALRAKFLVRIEPGVLGDLQARTEGELSAGYARLSKSANAWGMSRLPPAALAAQLPSCFSVDIENAPLAFQFAVDQLSPDALSGQGAVFARLAEPRVVARALKSIPMRGLFERRLVLGGKNVRRLKVPSMPEVFYHLDGADTWAASDAAKMELILKKEAPRFVPLFELGLLPQRLQNLEELVGLALRGAGFNDPALPQRQAQRLSRYKSLTLRGEFNSAGLAVEADAIRSPLGQ